MKEKKRLNLKNQFDIRTECFVLVQFIFRCCYVLIKSSFYCNCSQLNFEDGNFFRICCKMLQRKSDVHVLFTVEVNLKVDGKTFNCDIF